MTTLQISKPSGAEAITVADSYIPLERLNVKRERSLADMPLMHEGTAAAGTLSTPFDALRSFCSQKSLSECFLKFDAQAPLKTANIEKSKFYIWSVVMS